MSDKNAQRLAAITAFAAVLASCAFMIWVISLIVKAV